MFGTLSSVNFCRRVLSFCLLLVLATAARRESKDERTGTHEQSTITRLQTRQQLKSNWTNTSAKQERPARCLLAYQHRRTDTHAHGHWEEAQASERQSERGGEPVCRGPAFVRACVWVCWHIQDGRTVKQCGRWSKRDSCCLASGQYACHTSAWRAGRVFLQVTGCSCSFSMLFVCPACCCCSLRSSASFNNLSAARLSALDTHIRTSPSSVALRFGCLFALRRSPSSFFLLARCQAVTTIIDRSVCDYVVYLWALTCVQICLTIFELCLYAYDWAWEQDG